MEPSERESHSRGLFRFAILACAATFFLLIAGGMVTSTDSGDAVPDWWFVPISYGTFMPKMVGGVFYEHGHRVVATTVGILMIILTVWLAKAERRRWVRRLGYVTMAAVVIQGTLGGIRVLFGIYQWFRPIVAIVHACLAQSIFCMIVALALFTSRRWQKTPDRERDLGPLPFLTSLTTFALFVQLVLGAVMRHYRAGLVVHISFAVVVALLVIVTAGFVLKYAGNALAGPTTALLGLLALQIGLGLGTYAILAAGFERSTTAGALRLGVITGHLAVGALLLASSLVLALLAHKITTKQQQEPLPAPAVVES